MNLSTTKTRATKPPSHGAHKNKKENIVYMIVIKVYMYVIKELLSGAHGFKSVWLGVAGFLGVAWCGFANKCQATQFFSSLFLCDWFSIDLPFAWLGGLVAQKKATDQIGFCFFCNRSVK